MIKFMNVTHEKFVIDCCTKAKNNDCYHLALFYCLGLTEDCRNNINSLYDFSTGYVTGNISSENFGWITGTDIRIIRLAYNLYNNGAPTAYKITNPEEKEDELFNYLPTSIFSYLSSEIMEYAFEAIRIRFEKV